MPGMPVFQSSPSELKEQIFILEDNTTDNLVPVVGTSDGALRTYTILGGSTAEIGVVTLSPASQVGLVTGTSVINELVYTGIDAFTGGDTLTPYTIPASGSVSTLSHEIASRASYNFLIQNNGTVSMKYAVKISPDEINWFDDIPGASPISVSAGKGAIATVTHFSRFVKLIFTGGTADVEILCCFQSQY